MGDSAHPFLPISAQAATQSMEDGVTLTICLREAGKENVSAAVTAFQDIRYDRIKAVQETGETTRDVSSSITDLAALLTSCCSCGIKHIGIRLRGTLRYVKRGTPHLRAERNEPLANLAALRI